MKYCIEYVYVSLLGLPSELMELAVVDAESREHATTIGDGTGEYVLERYLERRGDVKTGNDLYDLRVNTIINWTKSRIEVGHEIQRACQEPEVTKESQAVGGSDALLYGINDMPPECAGGATGWGG